MKRHIDPIGHTNSRKNPKNIMDDQVTYYNISCKLQSSGSTFNYAVYLLDTSSCFDVMLNHQHTIELLWPNGDKTVHKVKVNVTTNLEKYDEEYGDTIRNIYVWALVDVELHGSIINIKLTDINGIKARIVTTHKTPW